MPVRDTITEQVEITEATPINDGQEWSIKAMSSISQYPVGPWKKAHDGNLISKGQRVVVTMVRGRLKEGKDPDREFNYFWELAEWNTDAAPTPAPAASSGGKEWVPQEEYDAAKNQRIAWGSAVNNACHLLCEIFSADQIREEFEGCVNQLAGEIYAIITAGPPQEQAPEAPETPVAASEAGEPSNRPQRPAPKSSEEKMVQLNKARFDEHGTEVYAPERIAAFICETYGEEQSARTLTSEQVDFVIDTILAGRINGPVTAEATEEPPF